MKCRCLCQWLCPTRKKPEGPYDVHEQTFEMDENFGGDNYQSQKNNSDPSRRQATGDTHKQQSNQSLSIKSDLPSTQIKVDLQSDQKRFMQNKNKIQQQSIQTKQNSTAEQPQPIQIQPPKQPQPEPPVQQKPKPKRNIQPSKFVKKPIDLTNYYFKQQNNQFKVKPINSLDCQQFNIQNCKNGKYFIFDISANLYIDDCQDCFIFAAPVQSSIFVRNCKNITLIGITGQFRTVNCYGGHFSIYCKSQPVIQSSSDIHFSSLQCPEYPQLRKQMEKVKFYPWNNNWSQIHNFTKVEGEMHHVLDRQPQHNLEIDWQRAFSQSGTSQSSPVQQVVPFIQGIFPLDHQPSKVLLVLSKQISENDDLVLEWVFKNNVHTLRASKAKLSGKNYLTTVLLIDQSVGEGIEQQIQYSSIGDPVPIRQEDQIRKGQAKYFIQFKDQR